MLLKIFGDLERCSMSALEQTVPSNQRPFEVIAEILHAVQFLE